MPQNSFEPPNAGIKEAHDNYPRVLQLGFLGTGLLSVFTLWWLLSTASILHFVLFYLFDSGKWRKLVQRQQLPSLEAFAVDALVNAVVESVCHFLCCWHLLCEFPV